MGAVIDHLIFATPSIEDTAARWAAQGVASYHGGRHPALGTENRIVPLGDSYIELLGPAPFEERYLGWMVRGVPMGNDAVPMQRVRADGSVLSWRLAGVMAPSIWELDPLVPIRIEWDEGAVLPGQVDPIGVLSAVSIDPAEGIRAACVTLPGGKEVVLGASSWVGRRP